MPDKPPDQTWELTLNGHAHLVEARGSMNHLVRWYVDGELVAEKKAMEDKLRLQAEDRRRTRRRSALTRDATRRSRPLSASPPPSKPKGGNELEDDDQQAPGPP